QIAYNKRASKNKYYMQPYLIDILNNLNSALAEYSDYVKQVDHNPELYLANPVSAMKLMRHMSQDWAAWQRVMAAPLASEQILMQKRLLALTPDYLSFQQAAKQLQSVVNFYNYQPASFLQHSQHLRLNSLDCYHMGVELLEQEDYEDAAAWLTVAAENYTTTPQNDLIGIPLWRVYEMQFEALFKIHMQRSAQEALSAALELAPDNPQLLKQQRRLEHQSTEHRLMDLIQKPAVVISELQQQCGSSPKRDNRLTSEYNRWNADFLQLAQLKVEYQWLDPDVMLFRSGIYDREIQHVKLAFAGCPESHKFEDLPGIKGCLVPSSYSLRIRRISERLLDMAGLDNSMDGFFVLQYGSTDAFQPLLLDTVRFVFRLLSFQLLLIFDVQLLEVDLENVEATAIVFLNDVALGGALVLPNTDLVFHPSRGDALITYNDGNFEHTMCPNMVGTSM
ncbi:hypothetical protein KR044_003440, partial [Drosophila immigrans]